MAETTWQVVSGDWNDPADWSAGVPSATEAADFHAAIAYREEVRR